MPSQFFGLNIAYTGLLASNAAMNTTSNNIANVQTEGYSRQQVTQQASNALRVFQTYGCAGAGVETLAIERIRDEFYDGRFWDNNAQLGEYDMKQYYMQQLETYFDDDGKEYRIQDYLRSADGHRYAGSFKRSQQCHSQIPVRRLCRSFNRVFQRYGGQSGKSTEGYQPGDQTEGGSDQFPCR